MIDWATFITILPLILRFLIEFQIRVHKVIFQEYKLLSILKESHKTTNTLDKNFECPFFPMT